MDRGDLSDHVFINRGSSQSSFPSPSPSGSSSSSSVSLSPSASLVTSSSQGESQRSQEGYVSGSGGGGGGSDGEGRRGKDREGDVEVPHLYPFLPLTAFDDHMCAGFTPRYPDGRVQLPAKVRSKWFLADGTWD